MCPSGLPSAIRPRQVHQFKQGTHVGCCLPMLFDITDITNTLGEPHFKATRGVIGELLKSTRLTGELSPSNIRLSTKAIHSQQEKTLNCYVWVNKINISILLVNKRKKQKKKKQFR